jgi:dihydroflavonol-4-reductase
VSGGGAPPLFVTGATGFLGSVLVRCLARAGREVHALARSSAARAHLADVPVRWHAGELEDAATLERALAGVGPGADVGHGAALISYRTRDRQRAWRVNVEGTRTLLDASQRALVRRFLFVSSVVAVGAARDARSLLDEEAPWRGATSSSHYVASKRAAEELVLSRADTLDVVVANPGAIFGPAPRLSNTAHLLVRLAQGRLGPLAPPGSFSVVGVDDAAQGLVLALERGARGRRYILAESPWTLLEFLRLAADQLGVHGPRARVPAALWPFVVAGARIADWIHPLEGPTPQALALLGRHYRLDGSRARRELGWQPAPFPAVLASTVEWLRGSGHVSPVDGDRAAPTSPAR